MYWWASRKRHLNLYIILLHFNFHISFYQLKVQSQFVFYTYVFFFFSFFCVLPTIGGHAFVCNMMMICISMVLSLRTTHRKWGDVRVTSSIGILSSLAHENFYMSKFSVWSGIVRTWETFKVWIFVFLFFFGYLSRGAQFSEYILHILK